MIFIQCDGWRTPAVAVRALVLDMGPGYNPHAKLTSGERREEPHMRRVFLMVVVAGLALAACNGDHDSSNKNATSSSQFGPFDWSRDPNTIVVRLDSQALRADPVFVLNSIPPCTVWGDGRIVWTTTDGNGSEDVLEARADEATVRTFLEDIINRGFYTWEDELAPPSTVNAVVESVTVALYNEVRTIRRFTYWPQSGYAKILDSCRQLSDKPVQVLPQVGWISAYSVARDTQAPSWLWPPDAPFTLDELAEKGESRWLEGPLATEVWRSAREIRGDIQVVEQNENAFQVAIVVPGYSRDAAAPPSAEGDTAKSGS
jgi:hypothetical protein